MAPQPYKPWHLHTNFWATSKLFRALKFSMQGLWNPIREILKKHSGYLASDVQFHPTQYPNQLFWQSARCARFVASATATARDIFQIQVKMFSHDLLWEINVWMWYCFVYFQAQLCALVKSYPTGLPCCCILCWGWVSRRCGAAHDMTCQGAELLGVAMPVWPE